MNHPCTVPVPLGVYSSFGFGDRLGLATPGHLEALRQHGGAIRGIFAQQSIREMSRTQRTPANVLEAARTALQDAGFTDTWGADADHLKTPQDVERTAEAGFVFFTIDPSDHVDQNADSYNLSQIDAKFESQPWVDRYLGKTIQIEGGPSIRFDEVSVKRAAVKYGRAIVHALNLAGHIKQATAKRHQEHEIEISVDETRQPTTLAEHYIIADQLISHGVKLVSLAPRFIGEWEKGVDFIGDLQVLGKSLADHAAIAAQLGPYKLSLHSGSDKLSMYGLFARATRGRFHVKTAGTSYLEALRVVAHHDASLFRRIIDFCRRRYNTDRATYHVHATLDNVPPPEAIRDDKKLERVYLECWDTVPEGQGFTQAGRQILHCTFGSVLTEPAIGGEVKQLIAEHSDTHHKVLADHFGRHLDALNKGLD
ncbi:MAG: hypothetical protein IT445_03285 [Phycisphaeraceae bacterium]|nr:hypothetical protein [Phycisphaeraceae bacterium]